MPSRVRLPTRDEWICLMPGIIVTFLLIAIAVFGVSAGWLPRTVWTLLLMVLAGIFLILGLSLTPPVIHARERMLKASIIEPAEVDLEPVQAAHHGHITDEDTGGDINEN